MRPLPGDTVATRPPVPTPAGPTAAEMAALERRITQLELQLLDRDARIEDLHMRLDEARREVVRTLARLQTLATRAEAASAIAEAEIAAAPVDDAQVRDLLQMSTLEFSRQNYGGALYLANQAKSLATAARGNDGARGGRLAGEVAFAVPLRLEATVRGNVRGGPGLEHPVLLTVDPGAPLLAHSYLGDWVRVEAGDSRVGWIHVSLVARRSSP